jgi:AAA domain
MGVSREEARRAKEKAKQTHQAKGNGAAGQAQTGQPSVARPVVDVAKLCLTPAAWEARDIPPEDRLLGPFSTTTRTEISADTGLGKTMLGLGRAYAIRLGQDFLHWKAHRSGRVLYLDGEMPLELIQQRVKLTRSWFGIDEPVDDGLFILSRFDVEDMPPLDTPEGARWLLNLLDQLGRIDDITFDNRASLSNGDQAGDDASSQALKQLQREITKRSTGQLWLHHTGYQQDRGYGRKSREWELDTVAVGERIEERRDADVAMRLTFKKARRRTPENRADYEPVELELCQGQWLWQQADAGKVAVSKLGRNQKLVLDAATKLLASSDAKAPPGHPAGSAMVIKILALSEEVRKLMSCEAKHFATRFDEAVNGLANSRRLGHYDGLVWLPK